MDGVECTTMLRPYHTCCIQLTCHSTEDKDTRILENRKPLSTLESTSRWLGSHYLGHHFQRIEARLLLDYSTTTHPAPIVRHWIYQ